MIRMLDGFDEYSNHRYHTEVIEKQFQYEMKSWPQMITFRSFRDLIRREKYHDYFKKLTVLKKLKLYIIGSVPGLHRLIIASPFRPYLKSIFNLRTSTND